jgi:hypothetical protein
MDFETGVKGLAMIAGSLLIAAAILYGLAHWSFTHLLSLVIAWASAGWTVLALVITANTYHDGSLLTGDGIGKVVALWTLWVLPAWSAVYLWNREEGAVTALIPLIALIYLVWCIVTVYVGIFYFPSAATLVIASLLRTIAPSHGRRVLSSDGA